MAAACRKEKSMTMKPIEITLYDPETNEPIRTYVRAFIPWEILKGAIRLSKSIEPGEMNDEMLDQLAALVVAAFGDQFTVEQVTRGADVEEMLTAIQAITARASKLIGGGAGNPGGVTNPTKAAE